jgi:heme O synthase-like polyprenyltransferase
MNHSADQPAPAPIEFAPPSTLGPRVRLRAVLELMRVPNVFTAVADILLGYLFTHAELEPWQLVTLLIGSSALLYSAGMVLNDLFDRQQDAAERPGRPIPSGRVSTAGAGRLGFGMLAAGVVLAITAAWLSAEWRPAGVAVALAVMIVLYDGVLKRTPLAPLAMGSCRMLNVLLGMSLAAGAWQPVNWLVAAGVGLYIVGVTWFARTEAKVSNRWQLCGATLVMLAAMGVMASFPRWATGDEALPLKVPERWEAFWGMIALLIGWRCGLAVFDPRPVVVQAAVKNCIFSLIIIDAAASLTVQDVPHASIILAMLFPTMLLGYLFYST